MTSAQGAPDPAELALESRPNSMGRYGQFGGQYVPETLIPALAELEQAAAEAAVARERARHVEAELAGNCLV